jgi:small subunit ribosomal protein S17
MIEEEEQTPEEESAEVQSAEVQEEPAAEAPATEAAPAADEEPAPVVHPKERRKLKRSAHTGETRPTRTPDERAVERTEARRARALARRRYRLSQREKRAAQPKQPTPQIEAKEHGPGRARVRQGVVVSAKPDKTITVRIDVARRHRTYKKIVRSSSTLHAHDEKNEAHEGDTVRVIESRPISRTKRWRLVEVLERAR